MYNLADVLNLLQRFYPGGHAWKAVIPEAEFDISLNDEPGCQDVEGIAIDLDGNGTADIFYYDRDFWDPVALSSNNLDDYLRPLASSPSADETRMCEEKRNDFTPVGFPFSGRLLPVSDGKITSVMFAMHGATNGPVGEFLKRRPDMRCHILYSSDDYFPRFTAPSCSVRSFSLFTNRECDFPPCSGGIWVQNELVVSRNDFGELVASANDERGMKIYAAPLVDELGAIPVMTDDEVDTANMLASSKYLFTTAFDGYSPNDNALQMFGQGLEVVTIDNNHVDSAAHLDMILTPTEEVHDGKPVVVLAKGVPVHQEIAEEEALDTIARNLEASGFFVERIPYIYTADHHHIDLTSSTAYSYNNALLERYWEGGKLIKRIYLPWFRAYETYNREASALYEKYGYEVVPIHGLERAGASGGALYCMVKVTDREF